MHNYKKGIFDMTKVTQVSTYGQRNFDNFTNVM